MTLLQCTHNYRDGPDRYVCSKVVKEPPEWLHTSWVRNHTLHAKVMDSNLSLSLFFNQYFQLLLLQCTDTQHIFNVAKNQSLFCDKLTLQGHLCNFPCIWPKAGIKVLSSADWLDTLQIFFIQGQNQSVDENIIK